MLFRLSLANMLSGATVFLRISKQEQVNVELQGYVKARSGLVTKKTDVEESMVIEVPGLDFFD